MARSSVTISAAGISLARSTKSPCRSSTLSATPISSARVRAAAILVGDASTPVALSAPANSKLHMQRANPAPDIKNGLALKFSLLEKLDKHKRPHPKPVLAVSLQLPGRIPLAKLLT